MDLRIPFAISSLLLLAACGSGSSNSSAPPPVIPPSGIVANDDTYTFYIAPDNSTPYAENLFVLLNDTSPGGDALTLVGTGNPAHGTASFDPNCGIQTPIVPPPPPMPCVIYWPNVGFVGTDRFTYTAQSMSGHAVSADIEVTIADHYTLQGKVSAPAGSISATQVGFADQTERVPIGADGRFDLSVEVGVVSTILVADAPGMEPTFRAQLGLPGNPFPDLAGRTLPAAANLRLDAFSTVVQALLTASPAPYRAPAPVDWTDILDRTTLIQLALEAGGISAGFPDPVTIVSDPVVREQLRVRFGNQAIAQRQRLLLSDSDLLPLLPIAPTPLPRDLVAYAKNLSAWNDVLLVRFIDDATATYLTAYGGGEASWQAANGVITLTPTSGPEDLMTPLELRLIGNPGEIGFGVSLQSTGRLGNQLWNGQSAPPFFASTSLPGFYETSVSTLVDAIRVSEETHRLPVCLPPAGADAPIESTHAFHADPTGVIVETGAAFGWLQSAVLSIRYADGTLATFLTIAMLVDGSARVIGVVQFPDGEEVLCAGHEVPVP